MLVVIKDNQLPPFKWKLSRITELHPDKDDHIRIMSIKTVDGIVQRTLPKICILPVS